MNIKHLQLMSLADWQKTGVESNYGAITLCLRDVYAVRLLHERLDKLLVLKELCQESFKKSNPSHKYIKQLQQQVQLLIEYILNANNAEQADQLLSERAFYQQYYPRYVTHPPACSPMANALAAASLNDTSTQNTQAKRQRFKMQNCVKHLQDLYTGVIRQVSAQQQANDHQKLVARYTYYDREVYRLLPSKRHNGYVQLLVTGQHQHQRLIIQDFHTPVDGQSILIVTPEGDHFAIDERRDAERNNSSSSLHFGRAVLFAGRIQAQGKISLISNDDPHYETDLINMFMIRRIFRELGLYHINIAQHFYDDSRENLQSCIDRELAALYGFQSLRRSSLIEMPTYRIISDRVKVATASDEIQVTNRAFRFVAEQQMRWSQMLPESTPPPEIILTRHKKQLHRILHDPYIINKEKAITAVESRKSQKLLDFACKKTSAELTIMKNVLINIFQKVTDETQINFLSKFFMFIAHAMSSLGVSTSNDEKQSLITSFIIYRNQFLQDVRAQNVLPHECQKVLEQQCVY